MNELKPLTGQKYKCSKKILVKRITGWKIKINWSKKIGSQKMKREKKTCQKITHQKIYWLKGLTGQKLTGWKD